VKPVLLGYGFSLTNPSLRLNVFGSPKELVDELDSRRLEVAAVIEHDETTIESRDIFKAAPKIHVSGGPNAGGVLNLLAAIDESNPEAAARVLASDPMVISPGRPGADVPLLVAASRSSLEIVRLLVEAGAQPDVAGQFDMTPLHWATAKGALGVVTTLLEAGADLQRVSWFYVTAGDLAALNGCESVVRAIGHEGGAGLSPSEVLNRMREWSRPLGDGAKP